MCDLNNHHGVNPDSAYFIHLLWNLVGSNDQRSSITIVASPPSNGISQSNSSTTMDIDASIPFALVGEISDASPAADEKLRIGDQVLKLGNVEAGDDLLHKLASKVQSNQGRSIPVGVMRHVTPVNLTVAPRSWQGRGLLGSQMFIMPMLFKEIKHIQTILLRCILGLHLQVKKHA